MKMRLLAAVVLLSLTAMGSEKVVQLADGRVLHGELSDEQDGMVVLSMKVDAVTANVRIDKKDILSVREPSAVQMAPAAVAQVPQSVPVADETTVAKAKHWLALAKQEGSGGPPTVANPLLAGYYGYPYSAWQHWPWVFSLGGTTTYIGHHGHGHGHHGGKGYTK